jgi:hypothetical protein
MITSTETKTFQINVNGFVFTKPTAERVLLARQRQQEKQRRLREEFEFIVANYIEKGGSRNFLSQLEYKMTKQLKGEKFMNFDRTDFMHFEQLIEGADRWPALADPIHVLRMFLVHLREEGYILPQVKSYLWNMRTFTVKFTWDDTEPSEPIPSTKKSDAEGLRFERSYASDGSCRGRVVKAPEETRSHLYSGYYYNPKGKLVKED